MSTPPPLFQDRPFIPLATSRLVLRPLRASDAEPMANLAGNLEVAKTLARLPHPYGLQDAQEFIAYAQKSLREGPEICLALAMEERLTGEFLGVVGMEEDLGIWLGEPHWGKGYGKEAMETLIQYLFNTLEMPLLKASALSTNLASLAIFKRLGFEKTGTKTISPRSTGIPGESTLMELDRACYLEAYRSQKLPVLWVVAAALINAEGALLMAKRPEGKAMAGVWELPGGKIEAGESPEEALQRELEEELGIHVDEGDLTPLTFASYRYGHFHLVMPLYVCKKWEGTPQGREGQELRWITGNDLETLPTPPADIRLFYALADGLKSGSYSSSFSLTRAKTRRE